MNVHSSVFGENAYFGFHINNIFYFDFEFWYPIECNLDISTSFVYSEDNKMFCSDKDKLIMIN